MLQKGQSLHVVCHTKGQSVCHAEKDIHYQKGQAICHTKRTVYMAQKKDSLHVTQIGQSVCHTQEVPDRLRLTQQLDCVTINEE